MQALLHPEPGLATARCPPALAPSDAARSQPGQAHGSGASSGLCSAASPWVTRGSAGQLCSASADVGTLAKRRKLQRSSSSGAATPAL